MPVKPAHLECAEKTVRLLMWELENQGFTPADLSEKIGGAPRTYENYKYSAMPSMPVFCGMIRIGRPARVMKKLATACGGYFIRLKNNNTCSGTLAKQTSDIMSETADVIRVVARILEDGIITSGERSMINREIDEAIEALLRAKICLEQ